MHSSRVGPAGWLVAAIACAIWPAAYVADQSRAARHLVIATVDSAVPPQTLPLHTSLFTALLPIQHRVLDNADPAVSPAVVTLAQVLRSCRWQTAAFVGSRALAATRGLTTGFDIYDDGRVPGWPAPERRPGQEVVDRAVAWLNSAGEAPFFLWLNLSDAAADTLVARLVRALDDRGLGDDAVVIVAGEHRDVQGELRVSVTMRAPWIAAERIDGEIRVIDLAPTALDLLQVPSLLGDGRSLAQAMREHGSFATTRR